MQENSTKNRFEIEFLEEAKKFIGKLDEKDRTKIIYNIRKAHMEF